jgi:hypothetical protein
MTLQDSVWSSFVTEARTNKNKMANRVLPVSTSDAFEEEDENTQKEENSLFQIIYNYCAMSVQGVLDIMTRENAQSFVLWFLDSATFRLEISVV